MSLLPLSKFTSVATRSALSLQKFLLAHCYLSSGEQTEAIINSLIRFNTNANLVQLLRHILFIEIQHTAEESCLLRGTSVATKMLGDCALHFGRAALRDILKGPIEELKKKPLQMEIDPSKLGVASSPNSNRKNLLNFTENILERVLSFKSWPSEILHTCKNLAMVAEGFFPGSSYKVLSGFIFLRFICPAIVSPLLYGVTEGTLDPTVLRGLILATKLIQGLANQSVFEKEPYMAPFNNFITDNIPKMEAFFAYILETELADNLSVGPSENSVKMQPTPEQGEDAAVLCNAIVEILRDDPSTAGDVYFKAIGRDLAFFEMLLKRLRRSSPPPPVHGALTRSISMPETLHDEIPSPGPLPRSTFSLDRKIRRRESRSYSSVGSDTTTFSTSDPFDVRKWSPNDVANWLKQNDLAQYVKPWSAKHVDGRGLLRCIETSVLMDFGVQSLGDRKKISKLVEDVLLRSEFRFDLASWTQTDIINFLQKIGLSHLIELFQEGNVTGKMLAIIDDHALLRLGVASRADRNKITRLTTKIKERELMWKQKKCVTWSPEEVAQWMQRIGLEECAAKFRENEIEGSLLSDLKKEDLEMLGVTKLGHRKIFARELTKLLEACGGM